MSDSDLQMHKDILKKQSNYAFLNERVIVNPGFQACWNLQRCPHS